MKKEREKERKESLFKTYKFYFNQQEQKIFCDQPFAFFVALATMDGRVYYYQINPVYMCVCLI